MITYELLFLFSLLFTILIETGVLFLMLRHVFHRGTKNISLGMIAFAGAFASLTTLPYLWFVLPTFLQTRTALTLTGEILVFLIEAVFYAFVLRTTVKQSLILSFCCNLASFLLGLLIFSL